MWPNKMMDVTYAVAHDNLSKVIDTVIFAMLEMRRTSKIRYRNAYPNALSSTIPTPRGGTSSGPKEMNIPLDVHSPDSEADETSQS